jgi:hypothetical protein
MGDGFLTSGMRRTKKPRRAHFRAKRKLDRLLEIYLPLYMIHVSRYTEAPVVHIHKIASSTAPLLDGVSEFFACDKLGRTNAEAINCFDDDAAIATIARNQLTAGATNASLATIAG